MGNTSADQSTPLLDEARQLDLDCIGAPPAGLRFENLRRRGIDVLKISWSPEAGRTSSWLARLLPVISKSSQPKPWVVTFIDQEIRIEAPDKRKKAPAQTVIAFRDVKSVDVDPQSETPFASVKIGHTSGEIAFGHQMPHRTACWVRDRILLEAAGLSWHPIHNVGKRTTRLTVNPDQEAFRHWSAGPSRLVDLFLEHAPPHLHRLEEAFARGDMGGVRQNAHWLKSGCAAVGAAFLSELLQRLEIDVDIKSGNDVKSLVAHIGLEFRKVTDALSRLSNSARSQEFDVPATAMSTATAAIDAAPKWLRVLVVEDSLVNQEIVRESLLDAGCEVEIANDGREALAFAADQDFDVILMDCQMSGMDGFHATKSIRRMEMQQGRPRTPIIALTAHALLGDRELCLAAGMDDYLTKPFVDSQLVAMLRKWGPAAEPAADHAEPADQVDDSSADVDPVLSRQAS